MIATADRPARILFVEDEADIAEAVRVGLERAGHKVFWVENRRAAIAALAHIRLECATPPSDLVVILDIMLPDGRGYEILSQIRGDEILRRVPVVMLTGLAAPKFAEDGFLFGANAYLPKPFEPERLLETIRILQSETDRAA